MPKAAALPAAEKGRSSCPPDGPPEDPFLGWDLRFVFPHLPNFVAAGDPDLAPVLALVAQAVGLHPLHFGFVMVLNLTLGLLTPPLGVCLFVACGIARLSLEMLVKAIYPFLLAEIGVLFLCSYVPVLVLWISKKDRSLFR